MSNQTFLHDDFSWASGDLQIYDNQSGFVASIIFTIVNSVIVLMTFIVHKAVYKLLAKLPDRAINRIIYPSMVSVKFKQGNLTCAHKNIIVLKSPQSIRYENCFEVLEHKELKQRNIIWVIFDQFLPR